MSFYPDRHHPVFFLVDALNKLGIRADFAKDARTLDCWGMVFPDFDNRVLVWLIDNRWEHEKVKEDPAAKELLSRGAIVMHAQKRDMSRVGGTWMPLAASPDFHPVSMTKTADAAFVGYVRCDGRARLLSDIGHKFSLNLAQGVFGKQAIETYCGAKCGVNIPTRYGDPAAYDSMNMRCFEIPACGIPLVTSEDFYLAYQGFNDLKTCVTYGEKRSITEAVQIAMDSPQIGEAGQALVEKSHTYHQRALTVKEWLETNQQFGADDD
jgi:hypothetical protein